VEIHVQTTGSESTPKKDPYLKGPKRENSQIQPRQAISSQYRTRENKSRKVVQPLGKEKKNQFGDRANGSTDQDEQSENKKSL